MREFLIAAFVLGAAVVCYLLVKPRKVLAGEMDTPVNVERGRARSEAEMAAVDTDKLSESDSGEVARLAEFIEEVRTGEQTLVLGSRWAFEADPLSAPIPDGYVAEDPALFAGVIADRLSAFTWAADPAPAVSLSSVQVAEPEPLELASFTAEWTRADIERMVAEYKAGVKS